MKIFAKDELLQIRNSSLFTTSEERLIDGDITGSITNLIQYFDHRQKLGGFYEFVNKETGNDC
jgi:hypothetical protein